jgi:hypothetical protein
MPANTVDNPALSASQALVYMVTRSFGSVADID